MAVQAFPVHVHIRVYVYIIHNTSPVQVSLRSKRVHYMRLDKSAEYTRHTLFILRRCKFALLLVF